MNVEPENSGVAGRVVLVTGGSSGTGRRFAEILAARGARVAVAARRMQLVEEVSDGIVRAGGEAVAIPMDVADEASTVAAYDAIEAALGPVDTIVANAGVSFGGSMLGMSVKDFDATMSINVRGVFLTCREGARRMIAHGISEHGRGRVVVVSSVTGSWVPPGAAAYAASKAAVTQLSRAMAKDWSGKGINVNILAPGYMLTDMTAGLWETEKGRKLLDSFPRQRLMDVDVLDDALLYFCSDRCAQVTGSIFTIDDGQTL